MDPLLILQKYVKDDGLRKHCIATAAIMKSMAKEVGEDEYFWWKVGILHDIDYELVNGDMQRHGLLGYEILLKEGFDERTAEIVKRHNHHIFGNYEDRIEVALQAADSASGLIIACALVKGGRISEVTPKTVKKKFKEKSFAAGCDRERIILVEKIMPIEKFYEVAIRGLQEFKKELDLS